MRVLADCATCGEKDVEHYQSKRGKRPKPEVLRPCVACRKAREKAKRGVCPACKGSGLITPGAKHTHPTLEGFGG